LRPAVSLIRGAHVVEIDVVLKLTTVKLAGLNVDRVGGRRGEVDDAVRSGSHRPLEHVGVDRQIGGDLQRSAVDLHAPTDHRSQMDYEMELAAVGGEEPATVVTGFQVHPDNLMSFQLAAELSPHEALVTGDEDSHDSTRFNMRPNSSAM
jgi:hypothetical protein